LASSEKKRFYQNAAQFKDLQLNTNRAGYLLYATTKIIIKKIILTNLWNLEQQALYGNFASDSNH
jgi:hypothetical protein